MPNLLADPNNWVDQDGNSPPASWNGTSYVYAYTAGQPSTTFELNPKAGLVAQDGDVVAAQVMSAPVSDFWFVNGQNVQVVNYDWFAGGEGLYGPTNFSNDIPAGATQFGLRPGALQTTSSYTFALTPLASEPAPPPTDTANCDCDDTTGNKTLATLRRDLMVRLGFAAQADNPPPGMTDLLNSFLIEAQELLYRRYDVLRTERFYSWNLQAGVKFYDINANVETCTKRLDPRKVTWCGVHMDDTWYPLECGIPPELYSGSPNGWPQRYEVRQCIEVWPVPDQTSGTLVIKGHFGLEPFAADTDTTTIDDRLVFLLALANAKAHYGKPDANDYIAQMEQMMVNLVAGSHQTRRYIPGRPRMFDMVYTAPKPTVPFT